MPQTTVDYKAVAEAGSLAYPARMNVRGSVTNGDAASIPFGVGVVKDGADGVVDLPTATAEITADFRGISFRDPTKESKLDTPDGYETGDLMTIVEKGWVWVDVEDAVTSGDSVFCRAVAAGAEQLGAFRSDADGTDAVAVPNAVFRTSTSGAGLAIVELF
jgi:hypothetical protein